MNENLLGARHRTHSLANISAANGEVIDLLVKLAHANRWNIKEGLLGLQALTDQATDDPEKRQAYKDRFAVLLDGLE